MSKKASFIPPHQIETILNILENDNAESRQGYSLKYKTIFGIGIYTALRVSEIITLKYSDVFTPKTVVNILTVKRLKKRTKEFYSEIPVHPKLKRILLDYRKQYDSEENEVIKKYQKINTYLFPSVLNSTGHISYNAVKEKFDEVFNKVGLPSAKTHSMRRTALTMLKNAGVDYKVILSISGHSNIQELITYLEVTPDDTISAINKIKY